MKGIMEQIIESDTKEYTTSLTLEQIDDMINSFKPTPKDMVLGIYSIESFKMFYRQVKGNMDGITLETTQDVIQYIERLHRMFPHKH